MEKKIEYTETEWRKLDLLKKQQKALLPKKPLNFEEEYKKHNWMLKNEFKCYKEYLLEQEKIKSGKE